MKLSQSLFFVVAAALALAVGAAYSEDKVGKDKNDPGFAALDKNKDGSISRTEARGNPELSKKFKEADRNNDGKLSRGEYLWAMTKQDAKTAKEKVSDTLQKNKEYKEEQKREQGAATGGTRK
jgi:Ca2+-binding EF-hand superfamily protein